VTPLPPPLGTGEIVAWRLDQTAFAAAWDGGEGAFRAGGRWNSRGVRAVYTALDPATAILEVAVHKGFAALDTVAHVLTAATVLDPSKIHIVLPEDVANPNWLRPGIPGAGQQTFGDALGARHSFVLIPSAVSSHSWNLIFLASVAAGLYALRFQERFALDTRLHPPERLWASLRRQRRQRRDQMRLRGVIAVRRHRAKERLSGLQQQPHSLSVSDVGAATAWALRSTSRRTRPLSRRRATPRSKPSAFMARPPASLLRRGIGDDLLLSQLLVSASLCNIMCRELHMPTNLSIDPDLLNRALAVSGERTKKAAVTKALQEFIARREQKRLLELVGKLEWDEGFDYKPERSRH